MIHLLLAYAMSGQVAYSGVTIMVEGVPAWGGQGMAGGAQLYAVKNILYFRTATTQWSSTDADALKLASGLLAPVMTERNLVLTDVAKMEADSISENTALTALTAACHQLVLDENAGNFTKFDADEQTVATDEGKYDDAVALLKNERKKRNDDMAGVASTWATALTKLAPTLSGLVSSGKAKTL